MACGALQQSPSAAGPHGGQPGPDTDRPQAEGDGLGAALAWSSCDLHHTGVPKPTVLCQLVSWLARTVQAECGERIGSFKDRAAYCLGRGMPPRARSWTGSNSRDALASGCRPGKGEGGPARGSCRSVAALARTQQPSLVGRPRGRGESGRDDHQPIPDRSGAFRARCDALPNLLLAVPRTRWCRWRCYWSQPGSVCRKVNRLAVPVDGKVGAAGHRDGGAASRRLPTLGHPYIP